MAESNGGGETALKEEIWGHHARKLTEDERKKLEKDSVYISDFKRAKLEQDAKKNWDLFYKRNSTHFFKDRHWITREFPELLGPLIDDSTTILESEPKIRVESDPLKKVFLEAGCGVGNTVLPLLEENKDLFVYACDFSSKAIDLLKAHPDYREERCHAFVCDVAMEPLTAAIPDKVDLASLFFVLSAVAPEKMRLVMKNMFGVLRDGGLLLFRDYGLYDHAQLRFSKGHKIQENFYVRQDGTRAYYFSEEKLLELAKEAGFEVLTNSYVQKETVNHKEGICAPRIFIQAKLRKPLCLSM